MLILTIRSDNQAAEVGLFDPSGKLGYSTWQAHRQLAETIHQEIQKLLDTHSKQLSELTGIVCFEGPGSFTGLRIGLTVGNALAYGLKIPIVGTTGQSWIDEGLAHLHGGRDEKLILPYYGADPHITQPRK